MNESLCENTGIARTGAVAPRARIPSKLLQTVKTWRLETETETYSPQDRVDTETFNLKDRVDTKTFNLQDRDETETFQKTSRDRDVQDRDYMPADRGLIPITRLHPNTLNIKMLPYL